MTTIIVPFHGYSPGSTSSPWDFSRIARRRNLAISTQDEAGATIFALDAEKRTLLFAKKAREWGETLRQAIKSRSAREGF